MSLETMRLKLIDTAKTNALLKPLYKKAKSMTNHSFRIDSLNEVRFTPSDDEALRINLVLPIFRKTKVFGGISTAVKLLLGLSRALECDARIIVTGSEQYNEKWTYSVDGFTHNGTGKGVCFLSENASVDVRRRDIFIFTHWKTAFIFRGLLDWKRAEYRLADDTNRAIYLIQDYEPGFHAWSSEYVLAESTYKTNNDRTIAVFNSQELYTFFKKKGYAFSDELFFRPEINPSLKRILLERKDRNAPREKTIIIYGRPSEARNCFEIIRYSLDLWSRKYPEAGQWRVLSLGEGFESIKLNDITIVNKGKVSLEEYADIMLTASIGISLMASPHPSYPPLEMSTFGVRTITNTFECKDLSSFNGNIVSLDDMNPNGICDCLIDLCKKHEQTRYCPDINRDYLEGNDFQQVTDSLSEMIGKMVMA